MAICALWVALALSLCAQAQTAAGQKKPQRYLNTARGVGYTGSRVCARCHAAIYREYRETAMSRSMTSADDPLKMGVPTAPVTVYEGKFQRYYEIKRRGGILLQSDYEVGPDGKEVFRDTQRIAYLIGAGENGISYAVRKGDYLFEAPLSYYTRLHSWALSPGFEEGDYGFHRPILAECAVCHSGRARPAPDRPGAYLTPAFAELGIGCENCHGPGQLHVKERMAGAPLRGSIDTTIVNPADLPGQLADNICMFCHQAGDARVLQPGKRYADFRPGLPLDQTVAILAVPFTRASPPETPLLQHQQLMILSKCYRASNGKLRCITCHDPHYEPPPAQAAAYYRRKCLQCHTEQSCSLALSQRSNPSKGIRLDDCAGCHMPRQQLTRISHSALTNHRIIAYPGEPFPPEALHQTTAGESGLVNLDAGHGRESAALPAITLLQAYADIMGSHPEYKSRYEALLKSEFVKGSHDPLVLAGMARLDAAKQTPESLKSAVDLAGKAIASGSASAADYELYGELLAASGKRDAAIAALKRGIALNPYSTRLYKRLALVEAHFHNYEDALRMMKRELEIFPEDSSMRAVIRQVEAQNPAP